MVEESRPILVVGMHRSGTSMVAGVLARLIDDPVDPRPQPTNPHGQYERVDLRPYLDGLLLLRRSTWRHPPSDAGRWPQSAAVDIVARRALERLGPGQRVWKDPRLALTLPVWLRHLDQPRLVYVLRDPAEVAASLRRRDATTPSDAISLWQHYVVASITAAPADEVFVVSHRSALESPQAFVAGLAEWVGIVDPGRRDSAGSAVASASTSRVDRSALAPGAGELWARIESWVGPQVIDQSVIEDLPSTSDAIDRATLGDLIATGMRTVRRLVSGGAQGSHHGVDSP